MEKQEAGPTTLEQYELHVRRAQEKFGLGNWSIKVKIDRGISGCGRTWDNFEYLEALVKFNDRRIQREGRDPYSIAEHEILHLVFAPLTSFARRVLNRYVHDTELRARLDDEVDAWEHHALETVHRGFSPDAKRWNGTGLT